MTESSQLTQESIVFDINNPNWTSDKDTNLLFLRGVQTYMSHLLRVRGHVMLNDVYDALGSPRTRFGFTFGWMKEEGSKDIVFTVKPLSTNTFEITFDVDGEIVERFS
jgi:hypothetical protein